jgi:hypothetical protein
MFSLETQNSIADILSVTIAIVALTVSLWQLLSNRPRLRLDIDANIQILGSGFDAETIYIRYTVTNIGIQPTIITNVGIATYQNWLLYFFRHQSIGGIVYTSKNGPGDNLPKRLAPGDTATILALQNEEALQQLLFASIKSAWVSHTWGKLPFMIMLPRGFPAPNKPSIISKTESSL